MDDAAHSELWPQAERQPGGAPSSEVRVRVSGRDGGHTSHEAPVMHDRRPTLPHDLAAYAWVHTGPPSFLSFYDGALLAEDLDDVSMCDEPTPPPAGSYEPALLFGAGSVDSLTTDLLLDLWRNDVPRFAVTDAYLDDAEAYIIALMNEGMTVGKLVAICTLPVDDIVDRLCDLCARGIVVLDRSARPKT